MVARVLLVGCLTLVLLTFMCVAVQADVPMSEYVLFFFEQEREPIHQPVRFRIKCYGYSWDPGPDQPQRAPGTYDPALVYGISGDCPHYGCKINHSVYLNYKHLDYCDLSAETGGQEYTLPKFKSSPVDLSTCDGRKCSLRVDLVDAAVLPPLSPAAQTRAVPSPTRSIASLIPTRPPRDPSLPMVIDLTAVVEKRFLLALLVTLLIELPILCALARLVPEMRTIGWSRLLVTGILASALTLPYLWFLAPVFLRGVASLIVGEFVVFLVEAGIYLFVLEIGIRRALLVSFVANLVSLAIGLWLL